MKKIQVELKGETKVYGDEFDSQDFEQLKKIFQNLAILTLMLLKIAKI